MRITLTIALLLVACASDPNAPPPPIDDSPDADLPELPVAPEFDVPPETPADLPPEPVCPWDGLCGSLVDSEACGGWAVPCHDGVRCVDTDAEAGILCETGSSSSSSSDDGVTSVAG
jgi:hypothetical protein